MIDVRTCACTFACAYVNVGVFCEAYAKAFPEHGITTPVLTSVFLLFRQYWDPVYFADPKMWRQDDMGYFVSRLCTVFMYGRQPERGGATHFPHVSTGLPLGERGLPLPLPLPVDCLCLWTGSCTVFFIVI